MADKINLDIAKQATIVSNYPNSLDLPLQWRDSTTQELIDLSGNSYSMSLKGWYREDGASQRTTVDIEIEGELNNDNNRVTFYREDMTDVKGGKETEHEYRYTVVCTDVDGKVTVKLEGLYKLN